MKNLGNLEVKPAERTAKPGWRDPRMWIGIAIVAVSIVIGIRVISAADDSITVWAVDEAAGAGTTLSPEQLSARRIRFTDAQVGDLYLPTAETLPAELYLVRGVQAGELVPRSSLGSSADAAVVEVPIGVDTAAVPPSVRPGSHVDIYVTGAEGEAKRAKQLLANVVVVSVPTAAEGFGTGAVSQLVLAVPEVESGGLPSILGAAVAGRVTVVARRSES